MGKKNSKSWVEKVKEEDPLFDLVDIITLFNTILNSKINKKKATEFNAELLKLLQANKHEDLKKALSIYATEQKLTILTLDNNYLFSISASKGNFENFSFFRDVIEKGIISEIIRKNNFQVIYNFLAGEWLRAEKIERPASVNCIKCFRFFLDFITSDEIINKIKDSKLVKLKSVEDDFHTAVAQLEEGHHVKRVRVNSTSRLKLNP